MAYFQDTTQIQGVHFGSNWVGLIAPFAKSGAAPTGWLLCNGAAVSRSTYADLYGVIGTTWGSGDGNTTFNVPNFAGEFLRGFDDGRGADSGRNLASTQNHGRISCWSSCFQTNPHTGGWGFNGWGCQQIKHPGYPDAYGWAGPTRVESGSMYHINCGIGYGHERWTVNSGKSESTPRAYSVHYCIKF